MTERKRRWPPRLKRVPKPAVIASGPVAEIDVILRAAEAQLARAKGANAPSLAASPLVFILGPQGSGKTTAVVQSGMSTELLAGEVYRGETASPTHQVNVWHARDTALVEASARVAGEADAWRHLAHLLKPLSAGSVLKPQPQPARSVVLCFPCDEFFKPGASDAVPATAQALRAQLGELAHQLGVRVPVYVLFTKADAIRHFDAFVRTFSADEAREALGASVEPDSGSPHAYDERTTRRLERAFSELHQSLSARRLDVLAREHEPEWKPRAYEFPRELQRLAPMAVAFLRDLCRPGHLFDPVLRGFYFVGVQGVRVPDSIGATAPRQVAAVGGVGAGAGEGAGTHSDTFPPFTAAPSRMREVPRWDFLSRLFPEVVLADGLATRLAQTGMRAALRRRSSVWSSASFAVALSLAFTTSFITNRRLQAEARGAAAGVAGLPAYQADLPSVDALRRLDALRAQYLRLADYERNGAPLRYRWGLYSGSSMLPAVRRLYFTALDRSIFGSTRSTLRADLRSLPDTPRPTDDYRSVYNSLKAYLITTTNPDKATADFLTPVLLQHWLAEREVDSVRADLAARQFDTYASELRHGNPYVMAADSVLVSRARSFLRQFGGSERIYQLMLADADSAIAPIAFNLGPLGSSAYVTNSYEVPGAFTAAGWTFVDNALRNVDRFIAGELWVTGDNATWAADEKARLVAALRARYAVEYADHWRQFLQATSVQRYDGLRDASEKLRVLSSAQSPLLALFAVVSRHTDVPTAEVRTVFEPVRALTRRGARDNLVGPGNASYITALATLQSSVEQAAAGGQLGGGIAARVAQDAASALAAVREIAAEFTIDPAGQVHASVQGLLEAPVRGVGPLLRPAGRRD
jgi:type VI secretion system protein ImpL